MSAGPFEIAKYASTELAGAILPIKIQPETEGAFIGGVGNTRPAAAVTLGIRAKARGGRKSYGVHARLVTFRFTGDIPEGYTGDNLTIPALTPAFYTAAIAGAVGTYLGQAVVVVSRSPEIVK